MCTRGQAESGRSRCASRCRTCRSSAPAEGVEVCATPTSVCLKLDLVCPTLTMMFKTLARVCPTLTRVCPTRVLVQHPLGCVRQHSRKQAERCASRCRTCRSSAPGGLGFGVHGRGGVKGQGAGPRVQGPGCRVQGAGCRVQGSGCRVQGSGCRLQGSGFRVRSGFRVNLLSEGEEGVLANVVELGSHSVWCV